MLNAFWLYMPSLAVEMPELSKLMNDVMYVAWFSGLNATDRKLVEDSVEVEEDNDEDIDEDNNEDNVGDLDEE